VTDSRAPCTGKAAGWGCLIMFGLVFRQQFVVEVKCMYGNVLGTVKQGGWSCKV